MTVTDGTEGAHAVSIAMAALSDAKAQPADSNVIQFGGSTDAPVSQIVTGKEAAQLFEKLCNDYVKGPQSSEDEMWNHLAAEISRLTLERHSAKAQPAGSPTDLDRAWRAVDALGGTWPSKFLAEEDEFEREHRVGYQEGYDKALNDAIDAIEKLGGRDVQGADQ